MKCYYHIVWLYLLVFCTSQFNTQFKASPERIAIMLGGNLTVELVSSESQYDNISKCQIKFPTGKSSPEVFVNASLQEFKLQTGAPDTVHIKGNNRCRFSITSMSEVSNGVWHIEAFQPPQKSPPQTEITLLPIPKASEILEGVIGSFVTFDCEKSSSSKAMFCSIFNNLGELYSSDCSFRLDPVKVEHMGDWMCIMNVAGSMNQFTHTIHLIESPNKEGVYSSVENDENGVILKCTLVQPAFQMNWCRAISPTGKILLLNEGFLSGRYSSSFTTSPNTTCALRIEIPLNVHLEYGRWRIDIGKTVEDFTGCFIDLPNNTHAMQAAKVFSKPIGSSIIKNGSSLRIHCEVPWRAAYCYIRLPNGAFLKPEGFTSDRLLRVGVCMITAKFVKEDQAGRWTCGLSSDDGTEDKLFYTDVTVVTQPLHSVERILTPRWGEGAFLLCQSVEKKPLRYCRFTSPSGIGYSFKPNITDDARLSYWGMGLENGECGIQIRDIKAEDIGDWTCAVTFDSFSVEDFAIITLSKPVPPAAFTIGMSFTAIFICSILIALGFIVYRKKLARSRIVSETTALSDSRNSTASVINSRQSDYHPLFNRDSASATTLRSISGRNNEY